MLLPMAGATNQSGRALDVTLRVAVSSSRVKPGCNAFGSKSVAMIVSV